MRFYITDSEKNILDTNERKRSALKKAIELSDKIFPVIVYDSQAEVGKVNSWFVKSANEIMPRSRA